MPPQDIGMVVYALFADPEGNVIGLAKSAPPAPKPRKTTAKRSPVKRAPAKPKKPAKKATAKKATGRKTSKKTARRRG